MTTGGALVIMPRLYMAPEYAFRLAEPSDLAALRPLLQGFYTEDGFAWDDHVEPALGRLLADPTLGRVYLIESGREAIGYLVITFGFSLEFRGRDAFVDEFYVAPEHRGRGQGRRALQFAVEQARQFGVRAIHLEVAGGDDRARRLYRSVGFEERSHPLMTLRLDR